ncbi:MULTISPECIES: hypothetical protein [Streptosporangium]|uniref:DUF397 domain-containing protein n=1 Tax=Streptosporangium brasiliense TaxID=47480 RepID=A0ABT9RLV4_9ACTN|nr:hypothetical protein [Streptosporangium brasiliense]MDP9870269.1 hypothetical protein [Streptosporangium brasiliense]
MAQAAPTRRLSGNAAFRKRPAEKRNSTVDVGLSSTGNGTGVDKASPERGCPILFGDIHRNA